MMNRSKLFAALLASLALLPVLAAGRPACCVPSPVAATHGCCSAMAPAQATAPKGCCKAPVAPKTDAKLKEGAPVALSIASFVAGSPARTSTASIDSVSVRLARRAHHAEAPDDSPPDRLSQLHILLI